MTKTLWNHSESIGELVDIPGFIDSDITGYTVAAIIQGGCASGAYMPAVTYSQALETMSEHGESVLEYIEGVYGELPQVPTGTPWSGIAVFFLSCAVELWASGIAEELEDAIECQGEELLEIEEALTEDLDSQTIRIEGTHLLSYLMQRFNMTREEALKTMKEHGQDTTGLESE